jgi:CBS domain-containing membrane protein
MGTTVGDVMTPDPMTLGSDGTLSTAYMLMKKHGFRHVPIVDQGILVGIVSLTDIGRLGATVGSILTKRIDEVMTRSLVTSSPTESLTVAAGKMATRKINCLPVVADNKLVGIVTTYDLLDAFASRLRDDG